MPVGYVARASADHPPGFYGPPEGLLAVNTLAPADRLAALDFAPLNARLEAYQVGEPQDLRGPVLLAALALLALDALVVFLLAGGIGADPAPAPARAAAALLAARPVGRAHCLASARLRAGAAAQRAARADTPANLDFAMRATIETRLAYVVTGDAEVDNISKAGLQGLTLFLAQRTALEAGDPVGLDIARDELAFFPLIYWPIVPGAAKPSPAGAGAHRRLHEERRHRAVRHPRRHHGAARPGRRQPLARHGRAAHHPVLARHSRSSSRCRATTC